MIMYFVRYRLPNLLLILVAFLLAVVVGRAWNLFYLWWAVPFLFFVAALTVIQQVAVNTFYLLRYRRRIRKILRAQRHDDASSTA